MNVVLARNKNTLDQPVFFGGREFRATGNGAIGIYTRSSVAPQHDDLMSGPHEDVEMENTRLLKEVRLLRAEREALNKASM